MTDPRVLALTCRSAGRRLTEGRGDLIGAWELSPVTVLSARPPARLSSRGGPVHAPVVSVGGKLVRSRSSCRCGLRGWRRGRCMAISTRLGRCYRCPTRSLACHARRCVLEQGVQGCQRGQRRDRLHRRPHRAARDRVEHPHRDLLDAHMRRGPESATRCGAACSLDHVMDANRTSGPGMPGIEDGDFVACGRTIPDFPDRLVGPECLRRIRPSIQGLAKIEPENV